MHFIAQNLKFLRKERGWTQGEFARQLGVKRSMIGAYEEERADPKIPLLQLICQKFDLSLDELINTNLEGKGSSTSSFSGSSLRILPITIDASSNQETVILVPQKAAAGYLNGYADVEYIESLPSFDLAYPEISRGKTYRLFQIKGESMLPIPSGTYVIASYVLDWNHLKNDQLYVLLTKSEGIVFKRVLDNLKDGYLTLKSDNPAFESYDVSADDILEIWKTEGITSFNLDAWSRENTGEISVQLDELRSKLEDIEKRLA